MNRTNIYILLAAILAAIVLTWFGAQGHRHESVRSPVELIKEPGKARAGQGVQPPGN